LRIFRVYIEKNLEKKFITSFTAFTTILRLFTKKKNDELRLCVDYRELNKITIKNRYSLFLIKEVMNRLIEIKIYIKFNIRIVYNWIRVRARDEWNTTFRTRYEQFEYRVMLLNEWINKFLLRCDIVWRTTHARKLLWLHEKNSSKNKIMFYYLTSSYSKSNREMFDCMIVEKKEKRKKKTKSLIQNVSDQWELWQQI
jgi:hypothetical protein